MLWPPPRVVQQLGQEVAAAVAVRGVPQVVVRIDDRQVGLQRRLGRPLGQPGREIGTVPMDQSAIFTVGHACFLLVGEQAYGRSGERSMRICVYGAGAIGGNFAARLADAGNEVSIVARGAHLEAIRARGLTLLAGDKKIVAKVKASDRPADLGPQDAVLVTLKASGQHALADNIGPVARPRHAVAFVQNGIPWWYGHGLAKSRPPAPDLVAARSRRRARQGGRPAPRGRRGRELAQPRDRAGRGRERSARPQHPLGRRARRPRQPAHRGAARRAQGAPASARPRPPTSATRSGTS